MFLSMELGILFEFLNLPNDVNFLLNCFFQRRFKVIFFLNAFFFPSQFKKHTPRSKRVVTVFAFCLNFRNQYCNRK